MSKQKNICPGCGSDTFFRRHFTYGDAIVTSNDEILNQSTSDVALTGPYICVSCGQEYQTKEQLVTEAHYHDVITVETQAGYPKLTTRQNYIMWESDITAIKVSPNNYRILKNKLNTALPKAATEYVMMSLFDDHNYKVFIVESLVEEKMNFNHTFVSEKA